MAFNGGVERNVVSRRTAVLALTGMAGLLTGFVLGQLDQKDRSVIGRRDYLTFIEKKSDNITLENYIGWEDQHVVIKINEGRTTKNYILENDHGNLYQERK